MIGSPGPAQISIFGCTEGTLQTRVKDLYIGLLGGHYAFHVLINHVPHSFSGHHCASTKDHEVWEDGSAWVPLPQGHLDEKVLQRYELSFINSHETDAPLPRQWTLTELDMALKEERLIGKRDSKPEPIIANEVPFDGTKRYVAFWIWIDITLWESEIDHVYDFVMRWQPKYTVTKLDISVQNTTPMHELESLNLRSEHRLVSIWLLRQLNVCVPPA